MNLIIVESPTKSKTIAKFLKKDYQIAATVGHIRDLPRRSFGVDLEKDFKPHYITIRGKEKIIKKLKKLESKTDKTILATDSDREGEAIAWHVAKALKLNQDYERIVFHEITERAIKEALAKPTKIDLNLVNAQQARRILDRIVGYKLSPLLWEKIAKGLSAGRVQSAALRLIAQREKEIENFTAIEYWTIEASLSKTKGLSQKEKINELKATLIRKDGKTIPKLSIKTEKEAKKIENQLEKAQYVVREVIKEDRKRMPLPPFITSTLQQEAWKQLRFSSKLTMYLAQQLYEKGLITYHRSDSLNLSSFALRKAKEIIINNLGSNYWPSYSRKFKTKSKSAQEAHEAIRPSYPEKHPRDLRKKLDRRQSQLYDLIWRRFIASQMSPAIFDAVRADIEAGKYMFQAKGQMLKFDGFLKIYSLRYKQAHLPSLEPNEILNLKGLDCAQHFTQPPSRYTEASLIKELERNGIGRPSTYAPIISVIQERNYVGKDEKRRFYPTKIGIVVNNLLVQHFPKIVDIDFTAQIEKDLDKIAQGKKNWKKVLKEFYNPFNANLEKKYKEIEKRIEKTNKVCPKCKALLIKRMSKYGEFYGCSNFPKCDFIESIEKKLGIKCPKCKTGEIIKKRSKRGKIFYGCNNWPDCDFALWDKPNGKKCPKCNSLLIRDKRGNIRCSNKECGYIEK